MQSLRDSHGQTLESITVTPLKMKPVYTAVLVASLTFAAFSGFRSTAISQTTTNVHRSWQYKLATGPGLRDGTFLNKLGEDGWELVAVSPQTEVGSEMFVFKKAK